MSDRPTYGARCERSGKWWAVRVPELPGVHTQARRLDQVEGIARDAIALFLNGPEDSFDIRLDVVLPPAWEGRVTKAIRERATADEAVTTASEATSEAVHALIAAGLPVRDVGQLLGLSFQRVAALSARKELSLAKA